MLRIEPAGLHDLPGAYAVCLRTGDAGQDASGLYRDPDLLGHVYVGAYLAQGRGTQLVLADDEGVAGYLVSADNSPAFETWADEHWWPPLRQRYPLRDDGTPDARLIGKIHAPDRAEPAFARDYPAHLHVDLLPRVRGTGLGRVLIERLLAELGERQVAGLHFGVDGRNANAVGFYEHLGFRVLRDERPGVVMGMRLG